MTDEECFLLECWIRDPPKPSPLLTSWILPVCIAMVDSGGAEVPSEVRKTPMSHQVLTRSNKWNLPGVIVVAGCQGFCVVEWMGAVVLGNLGYWQT